MRAAAMTVTALALVAGCSGGGSGTTAPTVPPDKADANGWNKDSMAAIHALETRINKAEHGGCTDFGEPKRGEYVHGTQQRVKGPIPDGVGTCSSLGEELEISMFPSASVRDDFVNNRREKICLLSSKKDIGLPGLYWVVGDNWSIQPDGEGVARRLALGLHAQYQATGCNGRNPGWDSTSVAALEQMASKLEQSKLGCADVQMQDRDLVAKTVPYNSIGTPAAQANCTLIDGKTTIVLTAYNTPAAKTNELIRGELGRECVGSNTQIVRTGNVALFAGDPAVVAKLKNAVGGSVLPLNCKNLK